MRPIVRLMAIALIAQLLAAPVASGMLVLCFGSDGHVAVESASADLCCREWDAVHQGDPGEFAETVEAASGLCCSDVALSMQAATLTTPAPKAVPASTVPFTTSVFSAPSFSGSAGTIPLTAESPIAVSLRTVILRA